MDPRQEVGMTAMLEAHRTSEEPHRHHHPLKPEVGVGAAVTSEKNENLDDEYRVWSAVLQQPGEREPSRSRRQETQRGGAGGC